MLIIIHYNSNYCLLGESDDPVAIEVSSVTSAVATATDTSSAGDTISIIESSVEEPEEEGSNEPPEFTDSTTTSIITSLTPIATSLPASSTAVTQNSQNSSLSSQLPSDIAMDKVHKPVQPDGIAFPSRMFGTAKRSFQSSWFHIFPWLEYSVERDSVYCFPCRFFGVNPDSLLTVTGYSDWKHSKGKRGTLTIHDSSQKHKAAVLTWKDFQSTLHNDTSIANQLEKGRQKVIKENRQYVMHLLEVLLCCAQQGIPLRGHREVSHDDNDDGDNTINIGNFRSFVKLHSRHIDLLRNKLTSGAKNATLLSHDYQNSMLSVLAQSVLEYIINEVRAARYYTIRVDETKDISKEQLTLIL